jgi:hypothetical protein
MKFLLAGFALFMLLFTVSSCTKDCQDLDGDIQVHVEGVLGIPMADKTVYLYNTQQDMNDGRYWMRATQTDDYGNAYFYNLRPGHYWVSCSFYSVNGYVTAIGEGNVRSGKSLLLNIHP